MGAFSIVQTWKTLKAHGDGETNTRKNRKEFTMNENENQVIEEQVTETVEQPTESPKTYTQEEVDAIVGKRLARQEAKIRKETEKKYGRLEEVLKAGTGKQSVEEVTDTLTDFYQKKGIQIPQRPRYSDRDIEVLASAEAEEFISAGYEDVVEEVDRLAKVGVKNMNARERALFGKLCEHRQATERARELSQRGVTEDVYNSDEFKSFASKFNSKTPIGEIYDLFEKTKPKKNIRTMGSMRQGQNTGPKDYYTPEEIERLTEEDLDDPKVWEAVRRSMTGQ